MLRICPATDSKKFADNLAYTDANIYSVYKDNHDSTHKCSKVNIKELVKRENRFNLSKLKHCHRLKHNEKKCAQT